MSEITRILDRVQQGDAKAAEELVPLVYQQLRQLATVKMADQPAGHTLQPTALVHEAYLRLVGPEDKKWQNNSHFVAAAAEAMRHVLVDSARKKRRVKRGSGWQRVDLEAVELATDADPESLLAVHEALEEFAREDPEKAELVKVHFFVGLSLPEAAAMMGVSLATAKRHLAFARAWLYRYITRHS